MFEGVCVLCDVLVVVCYVGVQKKFVCNLKLVECVFGEWLCIVLWMMFDVQFDKKFFVMFVICMEIGFWQLLMFGYVEWCEWFVDVLVGVVFLVWMIWQVCCGDGLM